MGVRRSFGLAFALVSLAIAALVPSIALAVDPPPVGTITGQAYEYTTHEPIAGATMYAGLWGTGTQYQTTTDASGTFTFVGLPAGNYSVWGQLWGYQFNGSSWADLTGVVGDDVSISAYQAVVSGTVTHRGAPVSANLRLYSRSASDSPWVLDTQTWSNSDGEYYFCNKSGAEFAVGYEGGLTSSGYMKPCFYEGASTVESATPLTFDLATTMSGIDLSLEKPAPVVTGKVTKADGTPVANVEVRVYEQNGESWDWVSVSDPTDEKGAYAVRGVESGTYRFGVSEYSDRSTLWGASFFTTSGPSPSTVASASDVAVETSQTATGIDIVLPSAHETLVRDAYESDDATADAKPVAVDGVVRKHTLLPAGDDDWMSFEVVAGHTYTVETTGNPDYPLWSENTDTYLYLYDSNRRTKIVHNDDRGPGNYLSLITWTAPSTKTVYAKVTDWGSVAGYESLRGAYAFQVTDRGSAVETGSISGRVIDGVTAGGVPGAVIVVAGTLCYSDADGTYRVDGLAAGGYSGTVSASGYGNVSLNATIVNSGDQVTRDVTMTPNGTAGSAKLAGSVTSAYGRVASATVTAVQSGSGASTSTAASSDGVYAFEGIEPGTYSVTFSKAGYASATYAGVSIDASETVYRGGYLALLGRIGGTITAAAGPIAGASVIVDGAVTTATAADGGYSLRDIPLGLHTLRFSAAGFAPYSQEFSIDDADSLTIDRALSAQIVVPTKPIVRRTPSKSSLTYKRKRGRANFYLSVNVRDRSGKRLSGVLVYLQRSYDGKHWTKTYRLMTKASGTATKSLFSVRKQKLYYRWVVRPTSTHKQVVTAKQKVTIK